MLRCLFWTLFGFFMVALISGVMIGFVYLLVFLLSLFTAMFGHVVAIVILCDIVIIILWLMLCIIEGEI